MDTDELKDVDDGLDAGKGKGSDGDLGADGKKTGDTKKVDTKDTDKGGEKKFSQEEVNELIEKRLNREKKAGNKKTDEELDKLLEDRIKEKQRVSQMSDDERSKEETEATKRALDEREKAISYKERYSDTAEVLVSKDLNPGYTKFILGEDEETTFSNLKEFQSLYAVDIAKGVEGALQGKTPKVNVKNRVAVSLADYEKMSYSERVALKAKDPGLYERLSK